MANFDVNLRFLLDEAALARVKAGVSTIDDEMNNLDMSDVLKRELEELKKIGAYYDDRVKNLKDVSRLTSEGIKAQQVMNEIARRTNAEEMTRGKETRKNLQATKDIGKAYESNFDKIRKNRTLLNEYNKRIVGQKTDKFGLQQLEIDILNDAPKLLKAAERAELQKAKAAERTEKAYIRQSVELRRISTFATRVSTGLQRFGVGAELAGVGIVGGIFAEANRYAKDAENSSAATEEWRKQTDRLTQSRKQLDEVLVRETLPFIEKAADVMERISGFVEEHPDIVTGALKTGVFLVGIGVLAKATASGIRIVADLTYLSASTTQLLAGKTMATAAKEQLIAAGIMSKTGGIRGLGGTASAPGAGLATRTLAPLGLLTATGGATLLGGTLAAGLGLAIGAAVNDAISKRFGGAFSNQFATVGAYSAGNAFGKVSGLDPAEIERKSTVFAAIIGRLTGAIDESSPLWIKATNSVEKANRSLAGISDTLAGSLNEKAVVDAFTQWKEDDAKIVQDAMNERRNIVQKAESDLKKSASRFADSIKRIGETFNEQRSDIIGNYARQLADDEKQYAQARASVIRDAGEEIRQIEEENQEKMRELAEEHSQRVSELVADRDALGLLKEERRYEQEKNEAERGINDAIAREHRETALRLQEIDRRYAEERARKQAQYQEDLAENAARRAEALKQAREAHLEEVKEIREAKAAQLRELDTVLQQERTRRREVFIQQIRDLDHTLLGERNLKKQYYDFMLKDAETWLKNYRSALQGDSSGTGGRIPTGFPQRDMGGYVGTGLYRMAVNGVPEFVGSGSTTRFAENAIGGRLNQDNMMQAYSLLGQLKQGLQYNDNRRFAQGISAVDRRNIRQDTMEIVQSLLSGVLK